jgi:hypothetical protein
MRARGGGEVLRLAIDGFVVDLMVADVQIFWRPIVDARRL